MRTWPLRRWAVAVAVTVLAALVIGVPTGVIPTPLYTRMTPVLWWNYPVWAISSVLEGLLVATYVRLGPPAPAPPDAFPAPAARPDTLPAAADRGVWDSLPGMPPPGDGEVPSQETAAARPPRTARAVAGAVLSAFAVGCPVCNKLVVLAIGVSGALSYWAPAQPVLAVGTLALLAHALWRRLRTADVCVLPA